MPCDQIVDLLLDTILRYTSDFIRETENCVVLLVNNLGATPLMELAIATRRALIYLSTLLSLTHSHNLLIIGEETE
jgi:dihydroxyacetone kinase